MKELLIKLRDRVAKSKKIYGGLCYESMGLALMGEISDTEYLKLEEYIHKHRPKSGKHFDPLMADNLWFWPRGDVKPRLNWLNDKIKQFK